MRRELNNIHVPRVSGMSRWCRLPASFAGYTDGAAGGRIANILSFRKLHEAACGCDAASRRIGVLALGTAEQRVEQAEQRVALRAQLAEARARRFGLAGQVHGQQFGAEGVEFFVAGIDLRPDRVRAVALGPGP